MKLLDKWINPVQNGLVGLDIGSGAVKLVALRSTSAGWCASGAAYCDVDASEDKAAQRTHTLAAIRSCLSQVPQYAMRYAVCGLSGPDAAVRGFTFPTLPDSAIEQAVRFEAQQVCPIDMHHSVVDYQLMHPVAEEGDAPKTQSGVMVAGAEQAVNERCKLVREAGAKAALMDADGLAALNCLSELEDLNVCQTVGLIDLGWHSTNIILLGPKGLPFVRDLDTGGEKLLAEAASKTSSDLHTLHKMMRQDTDPVTDEILVAFHQAARPLVMNINETLKFYASQEKCAFSEKVYLCGGAALMPPLVNLLCDALPTEVTVFDPFAAIRVDAGVPGAELLKTRGPAFVVAAGLAMRTV